MRLLFVDFLMVNEFIRCEVIGVRSLFVVFFNGQ